MARAAGVAAVVGLMGPCVLGKDKLKRPKRWSDWKKDAENKMTFLGITESGQKVNFLRSCAGTERTKFWEMEVRVQFEATMEGEVAVAAHIYEHVVDNTKQNLLKRVSKDKAIIDLLRLKQGNWGFMNFLADVEDQTHLYHTWATLTGKDMRGSACSAVSRTGRWRRKRWPRSTDSSRSSRPLSTGRVQRLMLRH